MLTLLKLLEIHTNSHKTSPALSISMKD